MFVHIRDFTEHHKAPEIGDTIVYSVGADKQGRTCAKNAVHENDGGRFRDTHITALVLLLIAPGISVYRLAHVFDFRIVLGWAIGISLFTYFIYASDKKRAREGSWRVSENTLHLLELLGGWPGAFLAQRRLRHKCSKVNFQLVFWLIVAAYQFVAIDWQLNWRLSRQANRIYGQITKHDK